MVFVCVFLNSFSLLCVVVVCSRHDELVRSLTPKIVEQRQQQHIDLRKSLRMEAFSLYILLRGSKNLLLSISCLNVFKLFFVIWTQKKVKVLNICHLFIFIVVYLFLTTFSLGDILFPRLPLHTGFFSFLSHHGCTAPVWGRGAQFPTWPIGGSRTLTFVAGPCARPAVFVFFACATAHTGTHTVKACAC